MSSPTAHGPKPTTWAAWAPNTEVYIISKLGRAPAGACQTSLRATEIATHSRPARSIGRATALASRPASLPMSPHRPRSMATASGLGMYSKVLLRELGSEAPAEAAGRPPSQRPRAATRAGGTQPGPVPPPHRVGSASPMLRSGHLYHCTSTVASV